MQFPGFLVQGTVSALQEWDPDGSGPMRPVLVVGGSFVGAGGLAANNVIAYEPQSGTWSPLAAGVDGPIYALAVLPDHRLVVGGSFANAGTTVANGIATWDGSSWQPLGGGVSGGSVRSLAVHSSGDVVAGGDFSQAGATPTSSIARWDGSAWFPLGAGLTPIPTSALVGVRDLAWMPNGDLVAVGGFSGSGATPANQLARWNGTAWSSLIMPLTFLGGPRSLTATPVGVVVAATDLLDSVQLWDGTTWTALATLPSPGGQMRTVEYLPNGDLILGSGINPTAGTSGTVRRLGGGTVTTIGTVTSGGSLNSPMCFGRMPGTPSDHFVFGGNFTSIGGAGAGSIATWDGASWSGASILDGGARAVAAKADGTFFVGGSFTRFAGVPAANIAQFDGLGWSQVGAGLPNTVISLAVGRDGLLHAALQDQSVHVFDGTAWAPAPGAPQATKLVGGPGDRLAAVGNSIAVQTATGWQATNTTGGAAVTFSRDGTLLAAGFNVFPVVGRAARWNGSQWQSLDPNTQIYNGWPEAIAELPDGTLVVGGDFGLPALYVAQRLGNNWQAMGNGLNGRVVSLTVLPTGELLAVGVFTASGTQPLPGVAVWNGTDWLPHPAMPNGGAGAVALHPAGDLLWAGSPFGGFARLLSDCRSSVATVAVGCSAGGGNHRLVATTWPVVGGVARTEASNLPANAFACSIASVNAFNLPLANLVPSPPGCTLWVAPDALELSFAAGGRVATAVDVPSLSGLMGVTWRQQVMALAMDASGALVSVTVTPTLALTIGAQP